MDTITIPSWPRFVATVLTAPYTAPISAPYARAAINYAGRTQAFTGTDHTQIRSAILALVSAEAKRLGRPIAVNIQDDEDRFTLAVHENGVVQERDLAGTIPNNAETLLPITGNCTKCGDETPIAGPCTACREPWPFGKPLFPLPAAPRTLTIATETTPPEYFNHPVIVGRRPTQRAEFSLYVTPQELRTVSREQCLLEAAESGVRITDLGSANGTVVNGQLIAPHTVYLVPECDARIEIGDGDLLLQVSC